MPPPPPPYHQYHQQLAHPNSSSFGSQLNNHSVGARSRADSQATPPPGGSHVDALSAAAQRRIVLVGWGLSCHVAMYLASAKRLGQRHLAGVVLLGQPELPDQPSSLLQRLRRDAFRIRWIAELARLHERAGLPAELAPLLDGEAGDALRPEARTDWGHSFEAQREALLSACGEYVGPVLCCAGDRDYLSAMRRLWGQQLRAKGSNVEAVFVRGLPKAGFRSYSGSHDPIYSRHLVQFASSAFL